MFDLGSVQLKSAGCCAGGTFDLHWGSMTSSTPWSLIQYLIITSDFNKVRVLKHSYLLFPVLHPKMRKQIYSCKSHKTIAGMKK